MGFLRVLRFVGPVDIGIVVVIAVFAILPPRAQYVHAVVEGDAPKQFALALAEARTLAQPTDGTAVDDLTHKLDEGGQKDWAIDFAVLASERTKGSPNRWKALMAASTAFVDRFDVVPGLEYADGALAVCESVRAQDPNECPSPDQVRMQLYRANLNAGVKSGYNPRTERDKFVKASEGAILQIHIDPHDRERGSGSPPSKTGSGSAGSATVP